jgi:Mrp family chromosome partitioning ATPase
LKKESRDSKSVSAAIEDEIRERLNGVLVPGVSRSLSGLNLIREVNVSDGNASITLASAALNSGAQDWLESKVKETCISLAQVKSVEVHFTDSEPSKLNDISHVIAVMSGKGGVGKSLMASLIALSLARQGYEIGILDADITGPSIPRIFGLSARPGGSDTGILPVLTRSGIEIMSINLLLPKEDDAVIWRGPLIGRSITQFWEEVLWGKLDYLIVDLPPGTADASLTVMQTLPIDGVVIVFTPQDLVEMIVKKAVNMARLMEKPVLGVVENMSYITVPDTGQRIEPFGSSRGEELARAVGAPLLGQFPIDPELARLCDEGEIERYDSEVLNNFVDSFLRAMPAKVKQ